MAKPEGGGAITMDNENTQEDRKDTEIGLLQAMYPDQLRWNKQRQELKYHTDTGAALVLRLGHDYPGHDLPTLVQANDRNKNDLRDLTRAKIDDLHLQRDEEVLDTMIQAFGDLAEEGIAQDESSADTLPRRQAPAREAADAEGTHKTVVIWLHHLLNTSKRKLALNPTLEPQEISGLTKPGYPGILLYTGASHAVDQHVAELRNQRWQAFQVRLDEDTASPWALSHPTGIKEVESISELTQSIVGSDQRDLFLKAIRIR